MKIVPLLFAPAAAILLFGCAETQQTTDNHPSSSAISVPVQTAHPENPSPTLSGYVDTSYTAQVR
jgi:uncharacterized lipoprotein YajG